MIHLCTLSASFKRALQAFHTTQLGYWSEVINRAKACGEIRQALSTVTLVDTFVHILSGIIFQSAVCHQEIPLDQLQDEWDNFYQTTIEA